MEDYNYSSEIRTNIQHFVSVFDGTVITRFNKNREVKSRIKVNYLYGVKSPSLLDKVGLADQVKLPIVAIRVSGMQLDSSRNRNKIEEINYKDVDGSYVTLKAIPWNINIEMSILCRYQEDLDQIIENFAVNSNPYIAYSWREPKSNREVRVEVTWDGNMAVTYPSDEQTPKDFPHRITGTANFVIKTYIYKTNIEDVKPICFINDDIYITDRFFCNYKDMLVYTLSTEHIHYQIAGQPRIEFVKPYFVEAGTSPEITINGSGFDNTFVVFVSGSKEMYPNSLALLPGSGQGISDIFYGTPVPEFKITDFNTMTFTLPAPSAFGFIDIVAVNSCGYGQLTRDANRCSRALNPYPTDLPEHYSWTVAQFPYLNGLIVYNNLNPGTVIDCNQDIIQFNLEDCNKDAAIASIKDIMNTCNISLSDLS